jgi:hypothetical protein
MTKEFDALLESMLSEMMPASMMDDFGPGEMTSAVGKKLEELPGKSQHWGPLQKLNSEDRSKIIRAIINNVFTEKGNTYTPMADDRNQLKELIKSAIVKATKDHPEFKAGGKWAVQFLADRLANEELLGKVKYTTEGGEEIKKDVTQKEMNAALNKALADTKGQSVWKKSSQAEEPAAEEEVVEEPPAAEEEPAEDKQVQTVYVKAADLNSDDSDLQKAFSKLPDDKDMSWEEVIKKIGTSKALALLDVGGLSEEEKELEPGEDEDVPALDAADDEAPDLSNFDKLINPYYSDTRGSFDRFNGDY